MEFCDLFIGCFRVSVCDPILGMSHSIMGAQQQIKHKACLCFGPTQSQAIKPTRLDVTYLHNIIKTSRPTLSLSLTRTSSIALLCTHFVLPCAVPYVHTCNEGCDRSILHHFKSPSHFFSLMSIILVVGLVFKHPTSFWASLPNLVHPTPLLISQQHPSGTRSL